jgi:hypothetical protein
MLGSLLFVEKSKQREEDIEEESVWWWSVLLKVPRRSHWQKHAAKIAHMKA